MERKIWTREELETVFRVNDKGELERLFRGLDWRVIDCKCNTTNGYCDVWFKGSMIRYHAIVYILHHGTIEDVDAEIDHSNGNKLDNRIENLRLVSKRENQQNRESHREGRLTGCYLDKRCNKWQAQIVINSKNIGLGLSNTELEAHQIYCKAIELIEEYVDNKQFRNLLKKGD
jgi:hypothetical protein